MDASDRDRREQGGAADPGETVEILYDRYGSSMYYVARTLLGDDGLAEDAVQEAFLGFVRAGAAAASVEDPRGYLFAALRHAAAKLRARTARQPAPMAADWNAVAAPEQRPVAAERSALLEREMRGLPVEQREVVALKIDGGLTFAEIAACLGVSANTAASRYRYALEKLRDALGEAGYGS